MGVGVLHFLLGSFLTRFEKGGTFLGPACTERDNSSD